LGRDLEPNWGFLTDGELDMKEDVYEDEEAAVWRLQSKSSWEGEEGG